MLEKNVNNFDTLFRLAIAHCPNTFSIVEELVSYAKNGGSISSTMPDSKGLTAVDYVINNQSKSGYMKLIMFLIENKHALNFVFSEQQAKEMVKNIIGTISTNNQGLNLVEQIRRRRMTLAAAQLIDHVHKYLMDLPQGPRREAKEKELAKIMQPMLKKTRGIRNPLDLLLTEMEIFAKINLENDINNESLSLLVKMIQDGMINIGQLHTAIVELCEQGKNKQFVLVDYLCTDMSFRFLRNLIISKELRALKKINNDSYQVMRELMLMYISPYLLNRIDKILTLENEFNLPSDTEELILDCSRDDLGLSQNEREQ